MRRPPVAVLVAVGAIALTLACSSSTSPKPTYAGTWVVTSGAFDLGALSPASFTVTVRQVAADSYTVALPALTWTSVPETYDSLPEVIRFADTTSFGFVELRRSPTRLCDEIEIYGRGNATRDTLETARIYVFDTATVSNQLMCVPVHGGNATIVKQ